jgi:hypothetical protein
MWGFASSLGGLCLFEDNEFLMWLVSSLWQMVWRLHPARALPLERFRSESLMLFPPCLRLDLFKHLIVICPCARIVWPLMPWFKRLEHPIIHSVEDCFISLLVCHLLIRTTLVADVLNVLLDLHVPCFGSFCVYVYLFSCVFCFPCCCCCLGFSV